MEFLEIAAETAVLREGDDGGVVAQECHGGSEGSHAWQIEERAHQRAEYVFKQFDHSELHKQTAYGAGDHTDAHKVEHGVEQQVMGGVHDSVEHVGEAHDRPYIPEQGEDHCKAGHSGWNQAPQRE